MDNSDRFLQMVQSSYSTDRAVERFTKRVHEGLRQWEAHVVEESFAPGSKVLVYGCGAGREAFALERLGFRVAGVDLSSALIRSARDLAAARNSAAEFLVNDGLGLPFPAAAFDAVTLWSQVLGNVPSSTHRTQLLRECVRVLAPGGSISLSVHEREATLSALRAGSQDELVATWSDGPSESQGLEEGDVIVRSFDDGELCYWHYFSGDEIEALCRHVGLSDIVTRLSSDLGMSWSNLLIVGAREPQA
jgi:SAM-dependent methyltransferase